MIPTAKNSNLLVTLILNAGLYQNLINQLIKDFELSGVTIKLEQSILPDELVLILNNRIQQLIQYNFDTYLQLLYRVDIPEKTMQSDEIKNIIEISQKASFAILEREWQKVYLKNKFS